MGRVTHPTHSPGSEVKTAWPWGGVSPGCTGFPGGGVYVTEPTGRLQVLKGETRRAEETWQVAFGGTQDLRGEAAGGK